MKDRVTIKIPRELYDNLQDRIKDTGFSSVTEYITFNMRILASSDCMEDGRLSDGEVKVIKERLKRLGYL